MARIGAEADSQLTAEFLLNVPEAYNKNNILGITFSALSPEQQRNALTQLGKLYAKNVVFDPVDKALQFEGELAAVLILAIPTPMERIAFWQQFVEELNTKKYTDLTSKRS